MLEVAPQLKKIQDKYKGTRMIVDILSKHPRIRPERVLIETDTPYLAPPPHRAEPNEPAWVGLVGAALGALWAPRWTSRYGSVVASAYGIAVSGEMLVSTVLVFLAIMTVESDYTFLTRIEFFGESDFVPQSPH